MKPEERKKVLVVTSDVPFVRGGHRIIAENTTDALNRYGHQAELHYTPQNRFGRQLSGYLANRLTDLNYTEDGSKIDRIITMRFPSYAVKHPKNILWLVHRLREYYDLWEEYKKLLSLKGRVKETARRFLIQRLDEFFLSRNVERIYTISGQVTERLKRWGGFESTVLYPPVTPADWKSTGYGDYFLSVSRLMKHKRVDLFIKAAAEIKNKKMKFVIVGSGPEEENLKKLTASLKITGKIEFAGHLSQDELVNTYSGARALVFAPLREEFGFVTLEAFRSEKPVITALDSGGPTELIKNDRSGYIVKPDAYEIAERMNLYAENPELAEKHGKTGNIETAYINWQNTIKELMRD
ncbi:MAG: glycosyltransferase family 4 protein [Acidobacteria bacterium]|nr:glycosyltransferase family 4 protein [Acidobacteriota bacterium]